MKTRLVTNIDTECPAIWKTVKSQGISMQKEKVKEFLKNNKSQGILLCEIRFQ